MSLALVQHDERVGWVTTTAFLRAGDQLGMSGKALAGTIGVSESTISRLRRGEGGIDPEEKSGELALLFIRLFRALDAVIGGDVEKARMWFHAENHHLVGRPVDLAQTVRGLVNVVEYLARYPAVR